MNDKDAELGLLPEALALLLILDLEQLLLNILLQLFHEVDEGRARVVHFIDDQDPPTEKTAVRQVVA